MNTNHVAVTRTAIWDDPDFREKWNLPGEGDFLASFQKSLAVGNPEYRPRIPEWPQIQDIASRALDEVIVGTKSAKEAFGSANKSVYEVMQKAGYYK